MKKTILLAMILLIACNQKQVNTPTSDSQVSDLSASKEEPIITFDSGYICFDGTVYKVSARAQKVTPDDDLFAGYIFQGDTLSRISFSDEPEKFKLDAIKGVYYFTLGTSESGCGGIITMWVRRNKHKFFSFSIPGNCIRCAEPNVQYGISCACGDETMNKYKVITQVTNANEHSRVWVAFSKDSLTCYSHKEVNLDKGEFDTLSVTHAPYSCGIGILYIFKGVEPINDAILTNEQRSIFWSDLNCRACSNCGL